MRFLWIFSNEKMRGNRKKENTRKVFSYKAGVNDGEDPPVPIPNTEVKLTCAEDSWLETTCENR